jgi:hypothetical protein
MNIKKSLSNAFQDFSIGKHLLPTIIVIIVIVFIDIAAILLGVTLFAESIVKNKIDTAALRLKGTVDVTYEEINFNLLKFNTSIKNLKIAPTGKKDGVNIDLITIYDFDRKNEIPTNLNIVANGINIKVNNQMLNQTMPFLTALGFNNLNGNIELNYQYDAVKKDINLIKLSASIDKIGAIDIASHLGNLNLALFDNPVTIIMSLPNILLYSAEINFTDSAFLNRLIKLFAEKNNTSPELQMNIFITKIDEQFANATDDYSKKSITTLKKFINNPDKISIKVNPKRTISLGLLKEIEYAKLPELLSLEITAPEKSAPKSAEIKK